MSILSENEKFTRKLCDTLSKAYGVPYDLVRAIIDGLGFYVLHTLAEKGKYDREHGIKEKFKIEIPMIGTLELTPKKYNNTSAIKVSKFDGKTLVSGFKIREPYLAKIREAYYGGEYTNKKDKVIKIENFNWDDLEYPRAFEDIYDPIWNC